MDNFHEEKICLWKFKMEIVLGSVNLWDIEDGSKNAPPCNTDPNMLKEYQKRMKNTISIAGLNFVNN